MSQRRRDRGNERRGESDKAMEEGPTEGERHVKENETGTKK